MRYWLSILLSAASFMLPVGGVLLIAFFRTALFVVIGGICIVIGLIVKKPADEMRIQSRHDVEYDEFGRSKKKGSYERLSKAERNQIDLQKTADMERIMNSADMKKRIKQGSANPDKDIDALVGLVTVKQKMREMVARMEFDAQDKKKTADSSISGRHMVFYGPPGSGKTTVARILTGFLYKYGYIKKNKCVEIDGNYLKAGIDTALKTELTVQQAYDGVLFIDEAYSLMDDPYAGKEAIAELIKQMEDHRDRFILILAGYTDEMQYLLHANPGFSSRIKEYLDFPDYDNEEMMEIFRRMAETQGYTVSKDAFDSFVIRINKEKQRKSFGNARTARNILDESLDKHAFNYINGGMSKSDKYILRGMDISQDLKHSHM